MKIQIIWMITFLLKVNITMTMEMPKGKMSFEEYYEYIKACTKYNARFAQNSKDIEDIVNYQNFAIKTTGANGSDRSNMPLLVCLENKKLRDYKAK